MQKRIKIGGKKLSKKKIEENFPKLRRKPRVYKMLSKINGKRPTSRHILITFTTALLKNTLKDFRNNHKSSRTKNKNQIVMRDNIQNL